MSPLYPGYYPSAPLVYSWLILAMGEAIVFFCLVAALFLAFCHRWLEHHPSVASLLGKIMLGVIAGVLLCLSVYAIYHLGKGIVTLETYDFFRGGRRSYRYSSPSPRWVTWNANPFSYIFSLCFLGIIGFGTPVLVIQGLRKKLNIR